MAYSEKPRNSLELTLRATVPVTIAGQGLNAVLSLALILAVSRWLGPEGKGVQATLAAAAQMAAIALGFGYAGVLPFQLRGDVRLIRRVVATQALLVVAGFVLWAVGIWVNRGWKFWPEAIGAEWVLGALCLATIGQSFASSLALAVGDARSSAGASIVGTLLSALGIVGERVITGTLSAINVILWQGVGLGLGAWWAIGRVWRQSPSDLAIDRHADSRQSAPAPRRLDRGVAAAASLGLTSNVAAIAMTRGDIFLVDHFSGAAVAGVYSLAVFIAEIGAKIPQWTSGALTSVVASDPRTGVDRTLGLVMAAGTAGVAAFVIALCLEPFLAAALSAAAGPGYSGVALLVLAMGPRVIMQAALSLVAGNLAAHGYTRFHAGGSILGLVVMVGADIPLIPRFGAYGAAAGSFLGIATSMAVMSYGFARINALSMTELPMRSVRAFVHQWRASIGMLRDRARARN